MDKILQQTRENIQQFGLEVIMVHPGKYLPGFAYSVGLTETYHHPEICCFGLPSKLAHEIINDIAEMIKNGQRIQTGIDYTTIFEGSKAVFLPVDHENIGDYFNVALVHYDERELDVLQLIWTDRNDRYPWEADFEEQFLYDQPLLDRNAAFKFYEPKNRTAFTTRQWLEEHKPILVVAHDHEGDWQFLTGDQEPEDIRIVALEQVVLRDPSLNELFDLEFGERAFRDVAGGEWTREEMEEEAPE